MNDFQALRTRLLILLVGRHVAGGTGAHARLSVAFTVQIFVSRVPCVAPVPSLEREEAGAKGVGGEAVQRHRLVALQHLLQHVLCVRRVERRERLRVEEREDRLLHARDEAHEVLQLDVAVRTHVEEQERVAKRQVARTYRLGRTRQRALLVVLEHGR
eukprot:2969644-Pleurochrysis_carterae.AAC.9